MPFNADFYHQIKLIFSISFLLLFIATCVNQVPEEQANTDSWAVVSTEIFGPNISSATAGSISLMNGTYQVIVNQPTNHYAIQLSAPPAGAGSGIVLPPGEYAITGQVLVNQVNQDQTIVGEVVPWGTWTPNLIWKEMTVPKSGALVPINIAFTVKTEGQYQISLHFGKANTNASFEVSNINLRSKNGYCLQNLWPLDAIVCNEVVRRPNPDNWPAVVGWAVATTISKNPTSPSKIFIDWWTLEKVISGVTTPVFREDYSINGTQISGLIGVRQNPWSIPNRTESVLINSIVENGVLVIDLSPHNGQFLHWFTPRFSTEANARYYIRARIKTSGTATIQFGCDWWNSVTSSNWTGDCSNDPNIPDTTIVSTCESWVSDWLSSTNDFKEILVPVK